MARRSTEGEAKVVARQLKLGQPEVAALGLRFALGLQDDADFGSKMAQGVAAVEQEWLEHGSEEYQANFHYVHKGKALDPACLPPNVERQIQEGRYHGRELGPDDFDFEHGGMTLDSFVQHLNSRITGLKEVEVLALRLYTTTSYPRFNTPLRDQQTPHPFAMTVYHKVEGHKRLRKMDAADFTDEKFLYRGMKDMGLDDANFVAHGGTELAAMSTSASKTWPPGTQTAASRCF